MRIFSLYLRGNLSMPRKKNIMEVDIAFALSRTGSFEKKHFGDADQYHIYHLSNEEFMLRHKQDNPFKLLDETPGHGVRKKAEKIIELLKQFF